MLGGFSQIKTSQWSAGNINDRIQVPRNWNQVGQQCEKSTGLAIRQPLDLAFDIKSTLLSLCALKKTSLLTPLDLNFLICKRGIVMPHGIAGNIKYDDISESIWKRVVNKS